jgi:hypothetical protein
VKGNVALSLSNMNISFTKDKTIFIILVLYISYWFVGYYTSLINCIFPEFTDASQTKKE